MLEKSFSESELVLGLIGAVGTELKKVRDILADRLKVIGYEVVDVKVTNDVIKEIVKPEPSNDEYERISSLMDAGNEARKRSKDNSILALGAAGFIAGKRAKNPENDTPRHASRHAYIISSLKHPQEVEKLRAIYPLGFYLIGVHADEARRLDYLVNDKRIPEPLARKLIERDEDEHLDYGQRVADTFHLSDFFVRIDGDGDRLKTSIWRLLALLFGHPNVTPTFDEFAMFHAFTASLRSADLSRQVGAVIAVDQQVVATGANDAPKAGGGQYWPAVDKLPHEVRFPEDGRDFALGHDSNRVEQQKIIEDIVKQGTELGLDASKLEHALWTSRIRDLTEFGRVVHAEMDALLSCARMNISPVGGTLYTTTYPCHNCAKHIVVSGIRRVVFIEPYPKSKAIELHPDSIKVGFSDSAAAGEIGSMVLFEPFVGVGPRRFFDLFSMRLGSGYRLKRKDEDGKRREWKPEGGILRLQMMPASYLDLEFVASTMFNRARKKIEESNHAPS